MDLGYLSGRPLPPLPPDLMTASARVAAFLAGGGRGAVLSGVSGSGKGALIEHLLSGMPGRVLRVRNPGPGPLDLAAILHQLGQEPVDEADEQGLFFRTLAELAYDDYSAVLAIEDAHTLTGLAWSALSRVPGLGGPDLPGLILLLSGEPAMLAKMAAPGLELLRNSRRTLLLKLHPAGEADALRPTSMPRPLIKPAASAGWPSWLGRDLRLAGFAAAAGGLTAAAVLAWPHAPVLPPPAIQSQVNLAGAAPAAVPLTAAPILPEPEPAMPPPRDAAPAPETPAAAPASPPDRQLRREFDGFLDHAGRDTAKLTPAARQALFDEYLRWRVQRAAAHVPARP